jgi:hypothetical protein
MLLMRTVAPSLALLITSRLDSTSPIITIPGGGMRNPSSW